MNRGGAATSSLWARFATGNWIPGTACGAGLLYMLNAALTAQCPPESTFPVAFGRYLSMCEEDADIGGRTAFTHSQHSWNGVFEEPRYREGLLPYYRRVDVPIVQSKDNRMRQQRLVFYGINGLWRPVPPWLDEWIGD